MGNGASASPMSALGDVASRLAAGNGESKQSVESSQPAGSEASSASGAGAASSSRSQSPAGPASAAASETKPPSSAVADAASKPDETLMKVEAVRSLVVRLQKVRDSIAEQSKQMSESKILEKMTGDEVEVEKREVGTFHVSRDRCKSMEEYTDGTTIRRIDGSIERKLPDGTVEQISNTNEVTLRTPDGDIAVLAEHDTLLNQKRADGTQIQTNLETRVQIQVFPDGTRIETDANTKTTVTLFPDGKQVTVFDDTTQLTLFPDGTSRQVSPNGTVVTVDADGTKTQSNPDGSSIVVYKDGRKVRTLPNGNKIESFPNGVSC